MRTPSRLSLPLIPLLMVGMLSLACGGDGGGGPTDPGPTTPQASSVVITPAADTLTALGATTTLSARVLDSDGNEISGADVDWSCEDCGIVSVDAATGTATAVGNGVGVVTATVAGTTISATAEIQVFQVAVAVSVTPEAPTLTEIGATQQFAAVAVDANDNEVEGAPVLWISGNHAVATVDDAGLATATGAGSASITAAVQGVPGQAMLSVDAPAPVPTALQFLEQPVSGKIGQPMSVQVAVVDADGEVVTGSQALIELEIANNPSTQGRLYGTALASAWNGVATFSVAITEDEGTGYTLAARSSALTPATSDPFDIDTDAAVLVNTSYVDYIPGAAGSEAANLVATLDSVGVALAGFTDISESSLNSVLTDREILVIPELEAGDLAGALSAAAATRIRTFVEDGGTFMVFADFGTRDIDLLNAVFSLTLADASFANEPSSLDGAAALGTSFELGPLSIPWNDGTYQMDATSLPEEAKLIYASGLSPDLASVVVIPFGDGEIIFMAWDWYNAQPVGARDGGWIDVLLRAVGY